MSKAATRAYDIIRNAILEERFEAGAHLKETELVRLTGVSRTPVREALRRLAADQFVTQKPNQGTYVTRWHLSEVDEIFELRAMLEAYAARRAATRLSADQKAALYAAYHRIQEMLTAETLDIDLFLAENARFHRLILDAADSDPLDQTVSRLMQPPIVARTARGYSRDDLDHSNAHHRELLEAFEAGDGDWAAAIMETHIRSASRKFHLAYRGRSR